MAPVSSVHGDDAGEGSRLLHRLDSWKEIATHFHRDERTVRRWERVEGLPVHRHLHRARGSVYAFADELDGWWKARSARLTPRPYAPARTWLTALVAASLGLAAIAFVLHEVGALPAGQATTPGERGARASRPPSWPDDPEVWRAFAVARHQVLQRTGHRQEAREHLEFVVAQAPAFAEAHALLGETYLRLAVYDPPARAEAWSKAEAAVRRALALEGDLAAAHTVLGRILLLRDWNWASAEAEIARAIELDPDDLEARSTHALYLRSAGRVDEALAERQRVQRADPLNAYRLVAVGHDLAFARRYDEADRSFRRALELERDYRPALVGLVGVCARTGRFEEAAVWQLHYLRLSGQNDLASGYDEACRRDGPAAAERWLDRQRLVEYSRDAQNNLWRLAYTYARLGEREAALRCLELAFQRRDVGLLQARVDPDVDLLRGDPRFRHLLERVGPPD